MCLTCYSVALFLHPCFRTCGVGHQKVVWHTWVILGEHLDRCVFISIDVYPEDQPWDPGALGQKVLHGHGHGFGSTCARVFAANDQVSLDISLSRFSQVNQATERMKKREDPQSWHGMDGVRPSTQDVCF